MTTPAQLVNDIFIKKTDQDMGGARSMLTGFIEKQLEACGKVPEQLRVEFDKVANVITLSLFGIQDGKEVSGSKSWTEMGIMSENRPVTQLFMELVDEVFGSTEELCS
jgi:hypothetical protein